MKKKNKIKSPARIYFDSIKHYTRRMHYSLSAHLNGIYRAAKRQQSQFPDCPDFGDAREILGAAVKAESVGRTPYARLLGVMGLKVLANAIKQHAVRNSK